MMLRHSRCEIRYEDTLPTDYLLVASPYLPTPPLGPDMNQGQFLSGVEQV